MIKLNVSVYRPKPGHNGLFRETGWSINTYLYKKVLEIVSTAAGLTACIFPFLWSFVMWCWYSDRKNEWLSYTPWGEINLFLLAEGTVLFGWGAVVALDWYLRKYQSFRFD